LSGFVCMCVPVGIELVIEFILDVGPKTAEILGSLRHYKGSGSLL